MKKQTTRLLSLLLSLLMLATLLPVPAYAAEGEPNITRSVVDSMEPVSDLAEEEVEFVEELTAQRTLKQKAVEFETSVLLYFYVKGNYDTEEKRISYLEKLFDDAIGNHTYAYYTILGYGMEYAYAYESGYSFFGVQYTIVYSHSKSQEAELREKVQSIREQLDRLVNTSSHNERVYDYLLENVTYQKANPENLSDLILHSPYGALVLGKADSLGFALSYQLLAGAYIIEGTVNGEPHFWNYCTLGPVGSVVPQMNYYLDAACDAAEGSWSRFLVGTQTMADHIPYEEPESMSETDFDKNKVVDSGSLGDNATWTLTADTVLTISGEGEVAVTYPPPWEEYMYIIRLAKIEEGITAVSAELYRPYTVIYPSTLERIDGTIQGTSRVVFQGDRPTHDEEFLNRRYLTVFYPDHNKTWFEIADPIDNPFQVTWNGTGDHTWSDWSESKTPTCLETGTRVKKCNDCDLTWEQTLPLSYHRYEYYQIEATCTEGKRRGDKCTVCGDDRRYEDGDPLGHDLQLIKEITPATLHAHGEGEFTCKRCGVQDQFPIHYYVTDVTPPTCVYGGFTVYTCTVCKESHEGAYVEPAGHAWNEGVVVDAPADSNWGTRLYTCTVCGATNQRRAYDVTRISGKGRCQTALVAAETLRTQLKAEGFDSIILASGNNFADALAGSYLAAVKQAPILLYQAGAVNDVLFYINDKINRGGTVYLLGGAAAVPEDMAQQLTDIGINVKRLSGKGRFDTNLAILNEAGVAPGQEILIATGYNYADSLSASATGLPMLLVDSKSGKLSEAQREFLSGLSGSKLTILGGTGAVSPELETALGEYGEVRRLAGKGREETSALIAETYFPDANAVMLAYSKNFPDGLSGGPVANTMKAPLILTRAGAESAAAGFITVRSIYDVYIQGGTGALSDRTVSKALGGK